MDSTAVDSLGDTTGDSALGSTGHTTWEGDAAWGSGAVGSVLSGDACF
jgi:hypothetical protein